MLVVREGWGCNLYYRQEIGARDTGNRPGWLGPSPSKWWGLLDPSPLPGTCRTPLCWPLRPHPPAQPEKPACLDRPYCPSQKVNESPFRILLTPSLVSPGLFFILQPLLCPRLQGLPKQLLYPVPDAPTPSSVQPETQAFAQPPADRALRLCSSLAGCGWVSVRGMRGKADTSLHVHKEAIPAPACPALPRQAHHPILAPCPRLPFVEPGLCWVGQGGHDWAWTGWHEYAMWLSISSWGATWIMVTRAPKVCVCWGGHPG